MEDKKRYVILGIVILVIGGALYYFEPERVNRSGDAEDADIIVLSESERVQAKENKYERAKEISTPDGFINTDDITIGELIGKKVILIDFWTYSCINCQRTTPFLNAWYEKYHDEGLEIVGIHTPEFEFEKEYDNVLQATQQFGIEFPVVLDNDFSTWRSYKNRYWPRKYLIDIDGFIIYDHIGEGAYDETEGRIQQALAERKAVLAEEGDISSGTALPESEYEVTRTKPISPEVYFGAWRNDFLTNGTPGVEGVKKFTIPSDGAGLNQLYFDGEWDINYEYAESVREGSSLLFTYQAGKVFMVAESSTSDEVEMEIFINGERISDGMAGVDVVDGVLRVNESRLYEIVDASDNYGVFILQISAKEPGARLFTFTFGE